MAKLFLDTNWVFDITIRNTKKSRTLSEHEVYISPLSYHILFYTERANVPSQKLNDILLDLEIVTLNARVLKLSLEGPTKDLEDNIQLHSASESECDYFLTNDEKLLKMKFFGKTRIVNTIEGNV